MNKEDKEKLEQLKNKYPRIKKAFEDNPDIDVFLNVERDGDIVLNIVGEDEFPTEIYLADDNTAGRLFVGIEM